MSVYVCVNFFRWLRIQNVIVKLLVPWMMRALHLIMMMMMIIIVIVIIIIIH